MGEGYWEKEKAEEKASWLKNRRARNLAIAFGLIGFALLFYFITLARLGQAWARNLASTFNTPHNTLREKVKERSVADISLSKNSQLAFLIWGGVMLMLGLAYASVPLYRLFCQSTGFGGTPKVTTAPSEILGKKYISVRFDANVGLGLPWSFKPETPQIRLQVGETRTVFFTVTNLSDKETVGISSYNVTPEIFGSYFNKLTCFCFTEQPLKPKETMTMGVVFYLDPALEQDETAQQVENITLSYTFFVAKSAARSSPIVSVQRVGEN